MVFDMILQYHLTLIIGYYIGIYWYIINYPIIDH